MKRRLTFGFLLMGFTFTVTQGLLIRELLVAFFGNELSIGLILGSWLILEALGSGLLGRLASRWGDKPSSFAILQILFALFLPICLFGAYASRLIVGAVPGEGVGLMPIFWATFLILTPLALVDGAMFAFGSASFAHLTSRESPSIGRVYVYESVGAIVGGIIFTYLFIPFLFSMQIALVLTGLNLFSAALIITASDAQKGRRIARASGLLAVLIVFVAIVSLAISPWVRRAQDSASDLQWVGLDLVYSQNSVYGNVAVVQNENQYTFYADGIPILTAPDPDVVLSEELVHLPMLFIPQPERALVLSGGLGGVLSELEKYPLQEIVYAELDPLLIEAVRELSTPLTVQEFSDPRLKVEYIDGRLLVNRISWTSSEEYDLVIVNLPYPSTLQLNRFYTVEFFHAVKRMLSEDGLLVIESPGTLTYMSDELRDLNLMAYHTLRQVFPHVRPIPGDLTLWLASPSNAIETVPVEALVERWEQHDIETQLITESHIDLRMGQMHLDWFWRSLGEEATRGEAIVNQDLHPLGLLYGLSYWHALFSPRLSRLFAYTGQLSLWILGLFIAGFSLLFVVVVRLTRRGKGAVIPIAIAATGFSGMTADLVIIFAFQSLYGYVYHWIGLFITAFMAGLSLGGWLMTRRLDRVRDGKRTLLWLEIALLLYWLLVAVILNLLFAQFAQALSFTITLGILLLLNAVGGFLVGSQFPLANKMLLQGRNGSNGSIGFLYASDLFGAFLSSIAVSVVLMPVLGITKTCLLAAVLKLGSFMLVASLPKRS
jgi:spermidine synthase